VVIELLVEKFFSKDWSLVLSNETIFFVVAGKSLLRLLKVG